MAMNDIDLSKCFGEEARRTLFTPRQEGSVGPWRVGDRIETKDQAELLQAILEGQVEVVLPGSWVPASGHQIIITIDEKAVRERYDEYVRDHEWYRENKPEELEKHPPDSDYGVNGPCPFEKFLDGWADAVFGDMKYAAIYSTIERRRP